MSIDSIGSQWKPNIVCRYAQPPEGADDDAPEYIEGDYVCPRQRAPHWLPVCAYSGQAMADAPDVDVFDDSSALQEGQAELTEYEDVASEPAVRLGPVIERLVCRPDQKGCRD